MSTERQERFTALYARTYTPVRRFVERRVHPSHAEDVLSSVYLVAWRRLDELPTSDDAARAWLFATARRVLSNEYRSHERREALAVRLADAATSSAHTSGEDPDAVAARIDLAAAWQQLPATHQEAIALTALDGLDAPHAAQVLGISAVAYRLRLSRARRALRALTTSATSTRTATPAASAASQPGSTR